MNNLHRYITYDGTAVLSILDSTEMVGEMAKLHGTSATMTAVMGQALTGASLMGYGLKDKNDSLTLTIKGNGPAGTITAVSDWLGNVRCCCDNPYADIPATEDYRFDIGGAVGNEGNMYVVSDLGMETPYVGQIALTDGDIAKEITRYYAYSEQLPTVCSLGVTVERDLSVARAAGYLLQLLPGYPDETVDAIEKNLEGMPPLTQLLDEGKDYDYIANKLFDTLQPNELDSSESRYKCTCCRERMEKVLISLGKEELDKLASEQEVTEIVCHFCNTKYTFTADKLRALVSEM